MKTKQSGSDEILLGSHMSTAGGVPKAVDRGESIGCTAMQIFVKGNTRWAFPPLKPEDAKLFRERMKNSPIKSCIAHTIYLVNLGSANPELRQKSIDDMVDELTRCDALGVTGLVMHPGAHGGDGPDAGIARIASALDEIFAATPKGECQILLETTAGQGTAIGAQFEEIAAIIKQTKARKRLGVCLDTCHVFSAGYELRTKDGYEKTWSDFDRIIGLDQLKAIHVNDSKKPFASRKDRHEHIGKGEIGLEAFRMLMNDRNLRGIPMVLETDKGDDMAEDVENMAVLRSLIK
ncbi:MAG: deoxyribonuclease IV [Candidatus Sumerlaeaceae bacterium]|nr:deoxyribonuclease IV [Candidatus Sumerlaeaceae bacterium]